MQYFKLFLLGILISMQLPITAQVTYEPGRLRMENEKMIRTISFDHRRSVSKTLTIYDRPIQLTFGARGQNYWVYPSGEVEAVE